MMTFPGDRRLRSTRCLGWLLLICVLGGEGHAAVRQAWKTPPLHLPRPLPGHTNFVFSLYGIPSDVPTVRQIVEVMTTRGLGNGFDPGPTPRTATREVFEYLASVGWPVICYPGCADMQIAGGRCVLGQEAKDALAPMDRAGIFTAVQLGEWGYYLHNLSHNEPWWRDVYGPDFESMRPLMKPAGLAGYERRPASRREAHDVVKAYFDSRQRDLLQRLISVTGHSHYEAYAGQWGARCIGLEVGENIAFTQSKFAFARGAARRNGLPWSVQVSPWFHGACTTAGPLVRQPGGARGLDAGHSLSLYERLWLYGWFAGAAMVTPENSVAIFFEKPASPWSLTSHGEKAVEVFQLMRTRSRGTPHTPVAVVIDVLAGYNGYMDRPWGILEPTVGDRELRDLFDHQLFPGADHIRGKVDPANPEAAYLRPTPYGELFDVQLSDAPAEVLASYEVLLLAGDLDFTPEVLRNLQRVVSRGTRLLVSRTHHEALLQRAPRLARHRRLEVLDPWVNPDTRRTSAISRERLTRLAADLQPVGVEGDPVQVLFNRGEGGWVIGLFNPAGVVKQPSEPAVIDPAAVARVTLWPKFRWKSAHEWRSGRAMAAGDLLEVAVPPGGVVFVEIEER